MRINWGAPEGRFFDVGLDRGVLYPKRAVSDPIDATNFAKTPKNSFAEAPDDFWAVTTFSPVSDHPLGFSSATKVTPLVLAENANDMAWAVNLDQMAYSTTVRYVGIYVKSNVNATASLYLTDDGSVKAPTLATANLVAGEWTWMSTPGHATGLATLRVQPRPTRLAALTDAIWIGGVVSSDKPATSYFDGDTQRDAVHYYDWSSTKNNSKSLRLDIVDTAVPWIGLSSVDEEGGEGAATYYIDGRPFLYLPKPKEYKATLKAYTYPDAFARIMGVTEITDGMYLDSQMGESFDLTYRTLVGNSTEGVDHGYKIHLVYNATVSPQASTYESMSNSINPTTFSWEIQAVPVRVEGFRPTAHIIIDTRHMDPAKVAAIESLLYGDENTVPAIPSPQVIFDLLSFGDTIIVTDNGDGTFDVTGSYENVYMIDDGVFRVDNVDGSDNGDGTFTISTTNA